jgi:hypothetical protein
MEDEIDFAALANIDIDDELTTLAPASSPELSVEEASRHEGLSPAGQHLSMVFGDDATLSGPSSRAGTSARRKKRQPISKRHKIVRHNGHELHETF